MPDTIKTEEVEPITEFLPYFYRAAKKDFYARFRIDSCRVYWCCQVWRYSGYYTVNDKTSLSEQAKYSLEVRAREVDEVLIIPVPPEDVKKYNLHSTIRSLVFAPIK